MEDTGAELCSASLFAHNSTIFWENKRLSFPFKAFWAGYFEAAVRLPGVSVSTLLKFQCLTLELKVTLCYCGVKDWNRKSKSSPLLAGKHAFSFRGNRRRELGFHSDSWGKDVVTWKRGCSHPLKKPFSYLFIGERSKPALHSHRSQEVGPKAAALHLIFFTQASRGRHQKLSAGPPPPRSYYL